MRGQLLSGQIQLNPLKPNGTQLLAYDWPHQERPEWQDSDEQKQVTKFLLDNPVAFVLSDMRTGKTLSTLWAIDNALKALGNGARAIVLTTKSAMFDTWLKEVEGHLAGRRSATVIAGTPKQKVAALRAPADIIIANHDCLKAGGGASRDKYGRQHLHLRAGSFAEALFADRSIKLLVLDEVTAFKNANNSRSWLLKQFMKGNIPIIWALTGTPNPSSPLDAHGLARSIRADYRESRTAFRDRTMLQESKWSWRPKPGIAEVECAKILTPNIRYTYGDVFSPDSQKFEFVKTELSEQQSKLYSVLRKEGVLITTQGEMAPANDAAIRSKFIQVATGGFYNGEAINMVPSSPRLYSLRELMKGKGKVLLFVPFAFNVFQITEVIPGGLPMYKEMTPYHRAAALDKFRHDYSVKYLISDPALMAHGLDLSVSNTIIWYGPIDRHEIWQQANRRVVKPGGTSTVYMIHATALEKRVYQNSISKQSFQGLVLEEIMRGQNEE